MTPAPPDPSLPSRLRAFHERLPLAGDPPNALLALPDNRLLYLSAVLRDTPMPAPAMSPEAWRAYLDRLRPHGAHPTLTYRLRDRILHRDSARRDTPSQDPLLEPCIGFIPGCRFVEKL